MIMAIIKNFFGTDIDTESIKKPSDLYRIMHPDLFSDSHIEREKIDRDQFKYILSRLSTDMRQDAFEELTRRCVIKLITPNIIPQTGPMGGGDAKADFITYPVKDEVSAIWTVSDGGCKGDDVWAFAVSTTERWSQKMDRDVEKIVENISNCTRIYFCTNQIVSSRNREQKRQKYLNGKWNKETYILDQNWFMQAVYDQGCYNDAIDALGLGEQLKEVIVKGPNDIEREKRLSEIEAGLPKRLSDGVEDNFVADLLEAAILVRGLGRSEMEVNGRFAVALEAAKKYGFPQQEYECIYQKAWTEYYWYDNPNATLEGYYELKRMLDDETNVVRIEKIYNIYRLLITAHGLGLMNSPFEKGKEHQFFEKLCDKLSRQSSCYIFLNICLLEDKLIRCIHRKDEDVSKRETDINNILEELHDIIIKASRRLDINFESQVEVMIHIGRLIGINEKFDDLIDSLTDIQSERSKDISAANIQYERGIQHLNSQNYDSAVKHLSRSYVLYHKENTIENLIRTSGMLGKAYDEQDLLYSAKTCYCKALGLLIKAVGDNGRSDHLIVTLLVELCYLELRLGQLTTFLEWLTMLDGVVSSIPDYLDEPFLRSRGMMDVMLGARIYETTLDNNAYSLLPDILTRHQLQFASNVLLLKMGKKDAVSEDYKFLLDSEDSTRKYILQMTEKVRFLFPVTLNENKTGQLQTIAHGCTFKANFTGATYSQTYAELFLAFMEMLMDSRADRLFPSTSEIIFNIKCGTEGENKIEQGEKSNEYRVCLNKNTFSNQDNIWETLINMMGHVMSGSIIVKDLEQFLKKRQEDDLFMQRISLLTGYVNDVSNHSPNIRYAYLEMFSKQGDKKYSFKLESKKNRANTENKQSDVIVTSLIDVRLWDAAKWKGCGFLFTRDFSEPGIMVLMFENIVPGIKIFEKWEEDYRNDKLNIRIVIITGVDKNHPQWYKVLITPDLTEYLKDGMPKERYVVSSSRFHLMNAATDENIRALRMAYNRCSFIGRSASAIVNNQLSFDKDKRYNKVIPVRNVEFIEAWTIRVDTVESVAILPNDDVIIPMGREKDAPVLEVIAKKKNYGQEKL